MVRIVLVVVLRAIRRYIIHCRALRLCRRCGLRNDFVGYSDDSTKAYRRREGEAGHR